MVCREIKGGGSKDEPKGAVGASGRASGLPTAPNLVVFPWTWECGGCPMRVQESRARSRATRSTLIWEIPVQRKFARGSDRCDHRRRNWQPDHN